MIPKNTPYLKYKDILSTFSTLLSDKDAISEFEKLIKQITNKPYVYLFPYNRVGIYSFLKAYNWVNKDVLIPAYTCAVVANAVICSGNNPIFVDIDPTTYNMNPNDILSKITKDTVAIIATHMYGIPMDVKFLREIVPKNIKIIEDAALSMPGYNYGVDVGGISDVVLYSLDLNKMLTTVNGG